MFYYGFGKFSWPQWECVKELWKNGLSWSLRCLALAELGVSVWCLRGSREVGFLFCLPLFFPSLLLFCCITSWGVLTGLSPHHMRVSLKPLCVLKLTTDWILLVYSSFLQGDSGSQFLCCKWTWEASSPLKWLLSGILELMEVFGYFG